MHSPQKLRKVNKCLCLNNDTSDVDMFAVASLSARHTSLWLDDSGDFALQPIRQCVDDNEWQSMW